MKIASLLAALLLACCVSCSRNATFILSSPYQERVLVAQDKDTMEAIIDSAVTRGDRPLVAMELFPSGKVFRVASGTKVTIEGFRFSPSTVRKVRILEGENRGKEGWVYAGALQPDPGVHVLQAAR